MQEKERLFHRALSVNAGKIAFLRKSSVKKTLAWSFKDHGQRQIAVYRAVYSIVSPLSS
jgi:hypothetical protein